MTSREQANAAFLRNIFRKGPFHGHAFACSPPLIGLAEWPDYDYTLSDEPVEKWVPWVVENYQRQLRLLAELPHDNVPCAKLGTGTQVYAAAFGCQVYRPANNNPCAIPLVSCAAEADRLTEPRVEDCPGLCRVFELGHAVQRSLGDDVAIGPPDVQSGFDTAALIWDKTDFLCAMADPAGQGAVERLVGKCARLLKAFLSEFRRQFPGSSPCHCPDVWTPPEMGPWLSNDECGAFGTELFERFCLPELVDLAESFGGLGMHCCADAEHQFPSFRKIPGLYGFNRVAARHGYAPTIEQLGGPDGPVHVLSWLADDVIAQLIEQAPAGTRFIFHRGGLCPADAAEWLTRMRPLSPRTD